MRDKDVWWADGLRFTCRECGACCGCEPGVVWFSDEERDAMARELELTPEQFDQLYVWRRYDPLRPSLREKPNYDCVLLDSETKRCRVYDSRPSQCRSFPFWEELLSSREMWDRYSARCPGMDSGELHSAEEIRAMLAGQSS